jgi:hypothetical protein
LIISLAAFACVEKNCFSFLGHSFYVIERIAIEDKSDNSIVPDIDSFEVDVTLPQNIYTFSLKHLSGDKVIVLNSFSPQNIHFCIWQPPKISWI